MSCCLPISLRERFLGGLLAAHLVTSTVDISTGMQQTKKDRNSCFLLRMRSCPFSEWAVAGLHPEPSWLQLLKREQTELKIHFKGQRHSPRRRRSLLQSRTCFIFQNPTSPCGDNIDLQSFKQMPLDCSFLFLFSLSSDPRCFTVI